MFYIKQLQVQETLLIIKVLLINHSHPGSGVFGVWGFGVDGLVQAPACDHQSRSEQWWHAISRRRYLLRPTLTRKGLAY
jgi:hypothetical protein